MESVPRVIPDNEPAEVECQAATGEALGPSVFIQVINNLSLGLSRGSVNILLMSVLT